MEVSSEASERPEETAEVRVEDTHGVLAPVGELDPEALKDLWATLTAASLSIPGQAGFAHWKGRKPDRFARISAIVYDFDRDPPTDRERVAAAFDGVIELALRHEVERLRVPYDFGLSHGGIAPEAWHEILAERLRAIPPEAAEGMTVVIDVAAPFDPGRVHAALEVALATKH